MYLLGSSGKVQRQAMLRAPCVEMNDRVFEPRSLVHIWRSAHDATLQLRGVSLRDCLPSNNPADRLAKLSAGKTRNA